MSDDHLKSDTPRQDTTLPAFEQAPVTQPVSVAPPVQPPQGSAQQQAQIVQQYVVTEQSLQGLGGWLILFLIIFALNGIGYIMAFTYAISGIDDIGSSRVLSLIFTPFIAIASIASATLIALQRKFAIIVSLVTIGLSLLYSIVSLIVGYIETIAHTSSYSSHYSGSAENTIPVLIGSILVCVVFYGLVALYFIVSKRVKQTLIK